MGRGIKKNKSEYFPYFFNYLLATFHSDTNLNFFILKIRSLCKLKTFFELKMHQEKSIEF